MSSSNSPRKSSSKRVPPVSIDKCLFGPDGVCPPIFVKDSNDNDDENRSDKNDTTNSLTLDNLGINNENNNNKNSNGENDDDNNNSSENLNHKINIQELRRICSQGIDDAGSHRPVAWRVLLGHLPTDLNRWKPVLKRERQNYRNLISELFVDQGTQHNDGYDLRGHQSKRHSQMMHKGHRQKQQQQQQQQKDDIGGVESTPQESNNPVDNINVNTKESEEQVSNVNDTNDSDQTATNEKLNHEGKLNENEETEGNNDTKSASMLSSSDATDENTTTGDSTQTTATDNSSLSSNTELRNNNKNGGEKIPVHEPQQIDGYVELVPARIKEQWKKSGRDSVALANVISSDKSTTNHMNTLIVVDNEGNTYDKDKDSDRPNGRITVNDDPLSQDVDSKWHQFFENASLLDEIRKDVVRTHPDLFFFLETDYNLGQRRYAAIERILFVWAKLNKGVRYVQGMNEIVGTIYYVLANDLNEDWASEAEADTYFLFNTLMIEMRDVFVPDLDQHDTGIQGRISNIMSLLSLHDPEIRCHLDDCGIDASFFGVRWLTTLLSREFKLPDCIRLWDSMFASTHKDNFMRYVCVTMVMVVRDNLLKGDFSTCLRLLQSYPSTDIDRLLESSRALWIYESQVTLACHKGGISLQKALRSIAPPPSLIMAYGLPGGLAPQIPAVAAPPQADNNNQTQTVNSIRNSTSSAAGTLFSSAKDFLGSFGSGGNRSVQGWRKSNSSVT